MERNIFVGSSILHMYSKYEDIKAAKRLFESLNELNLGCWNAMVGGYVQCRYGLEAVNTVCFMHPKGVLMDEFTLIHAIHGLIVRKGYNLSSDLAALKLFTKFWGSSSTIEPDECTFSCVVEACFKTENVQAGRQIHGIIIKSGFASNDYVCRSLVHVCWGALISAFMDQGHTMAAIRFFSRLKEDEQHPDNVILSSTLNMYISHLLI
ncbi:putative tetratricopeptide-like helical domain superfamily [Helianthus anomalus]